MAIENQGSEKRQSVVTLQQAEGRAPTIGPEAPKKPARVHVDALVKDDLPRPKDGYKSEKLKWYHLGVLPGSPHQTVHVNGVCFTLAAETVLINRESRTTERSKRRGDLIKMSEDDFQKTVAKVKRKVIRWENKGQGRGHIENMDKPGFVLEPGDEPLGRFLFMKEVPTEFVDSTLNPLMSGASEPMEMIDVQPPQEPEDNSKESRKGK